MNRIELIGRICNKIESQVSEEESKRPLVVVLAVDNFKRNKEGEIIKESIFVPLKAWGSVAARIRTYKKTGDELFVEGHILTGSYDNKEGNKVYFSDLIIDKVSFLRNTKANSNNNDSNNNDTSKNNSSKTSEYEEVSSFDDPIGDMPFGF